MFNFKKVASVLSSAVMVSSTVALAAAANYPAPFVDGGAADVAVVYGSTAQATDLVAVTDITSNLQAKLAAQTATGTSTTSSVVSGDAYELFTGSSKIYLNDSLNKVRNSATDSNLPVVLADGSFEGDVTATYEQKITFNKHPRVQFGQHPTSSDDPVMALVLGTTSSNHIYNLTVTFNKGVNFTHSDSEGEELVLFGQKVVVGSATDNTNLILLKSAEELSLTSDDPTAEVTVEEKTYTVELVSSSDTAATVKITDSDGNSDSKEISQDASKTVQGLEVGITNADETNLKLSATVSVGASGGRLKLGNNAAVKTGSDEDTMDGTNVWFGDKGEQVLPGGNLTKIVFQIAAEDTDTDAMVDGNVFIDPVFGSIKLDFAGLSIPEVSSAREDIIIKNSGSDKMTVTFQAYEGTEAKTINWYYNKTTEAKLAETGNTGNDTIAVMDMERILKDSYVVVGNEDEGGLWKLKVVQNDTSSYTSSDIEFENVFTGNKQTATIEKDGQGTIDFAGKTYTVYYSDSRTTSGDEWVRLAYADGSRGTADNAVIYPTIETSKGAKLGFYKPLNISLGPHAQGLGWNGLNGTLAAMKFPDGDGYTTISVANGGNESDWHIGGATKATNLLNLSNASAGVVFTVGQLTYNLTAADAARTLNLGTERPDGTMNGSTLYLHDVSGAKIEEPAIVIFEEQDDSSGKTYEALIVNIEGGGTTAASIGVSDVETTWGKDAEFDEQQMESDTDLYKSADFWGTIITTDQSDTDSYTATISYPDEQVEAQIYVAEESAAITGSTVTGGSVTELGSVAVSDSEVGSVSGKNLVVVGGSCVNTVASDLLDGASCGSSWETATGVGSGSFLIETFTRTGDKVATLVAGYNAGDTTNAAKYLTTQAVDTTVGKKYVGTSATSATLQTETAAE